MTLIMTLINDTNCHCSVSMSFGWKKKGIPLNAGISLMNSFYKLQSVVFLIVNKATFQHFFFFTV